MAATTVVAGRGAPAAAAVAPADDATGWLATELTDGLVCTTRTSAFYDYGLTIDAAFAIQAIGGNEATVRQIRRSLRAAHG